MTLSRAATGALKTRDLFVPLMRPQIRRPFADSKSSIDSKGTCFDTPVTSELEEEREVARRLGGGVGALQSRSNGARGTYNLTY